MEMRPLGRTGLEVSAIGLGTAVYGGIFGKRGETELVSTLHRAIDAGINLIDTAPSYGEGRAEELLGRHLGQRREAVVLITKVGCYSEHDFDFSERRIRRELEASLRRLRTDRIDVLLGHDIEHGTPEQVIAETLPCLERLREEGKVLAVGVSGLPLRVLERAARATEIDVLLSYSRSCLHDQSLDRLVPLCRRSGYGLLSGSPLAMGLLSQAEPPSWHPAPAGLKAAVGRARDLCASEDRDLAFLAMQYAFRRPGVASVITGTGTVEHLEMNLRALYEAPDEDLTKRLLAVFAEIDHRCWASGDPRWSRLEGDV